MSAPLKIRAAAVASGLSADTIRYYERVDVLPAVPRGASGYREYSEQHLETLRFARRLRDLGCSLAEMSTLVRIYHDGSCREMREALIDATDGLVTRVQARLRELERAEQQLASLAAGLRGIEPDEHRVLTLNPCGCVEIVEREPEYIQAPSEVPA